MDNGGEKGMEGVGRGDNKTERQAMVKIIYFSFATLYVSRHGKCVSVVDLL